MQWICKHCNAIFEKNSLGRGSMPPDPPSIFARLRRALCSVITFRYFFLMPVSCLVFSPSQTLTDSQRDANLSKKSLSKLYLTSFTCSSGYIHDFYHSLLPLCSSNPIFSSFFKNCITMLANSLHKKLLGNCFE